MRVRTLTLTLTPGNECANALATESDTFWKVLWGNNVTEFSSASVSHVSACHLQRTVTERELREVREASERGPDLRGAVMDTDT